jgi:hypothetical protein
MTLRSMRTGLMAAALATTAILEPSGSTLASQQDMDRLAATKQWAAEVVVTSDCDRLGFDGSLTAIHNRIVTTYQFTRRVVDAPVLTWRGRASTTYRWSVTMGARDSREVEESAATFEIDGELQITDSTRISTSRPPGRPFTKTRYVGESVVDASTFDDQPPTAELFDVPPPTDAGTLSGRRTEFAYSLFGGVVLSCPAQRQWTLRAP